MKISPASRVAELLEQLRQAQRQIDEARSRIRKNDRENKLDQAWVDKLEGRMKEIAAQIATAREEQAKMLRQTLLSPGGGR